MTVDLQAIVRWHNARPRAIQISEHQLQVTALAVPFWKAQMTAEAIFRYQIGTYSEQSAALALLAYNTALTEHAMRLEAFHQRELETRRRAARNPEDITNGAGALFRSFEKGALGASAPRPPGEMDAVTFSYSEPLTAAFALDVLKPACASKSLSQRVDGTVFDWLVVHGSFGGLPPDVRKIIPDDALIRGHVDDVVAPAQTNAIRAKIAARRDRYVGDYEILQCNLRPEPWVDFCLVYEVRIEADRRKTTLLVGTDGDIYGEALRLRSKLTAPAIAALLIVAAGGGGWLVGNKGANQSTTASTSRLDPTSALVAPNVNFSRTEPPVNSEPARASEPTTTISAAVAESASSQEHVAAAPSATQSTPLIQAPPASDGVAEMLRLAASGRWEAVEFLAGSLKSTAQTPQRGQRRTARQLNDEGLGKMAQHQFAEAADLFKAAVSADPSDLEILNNLGHALVSAGQFSEAADVLDGVLTRAPERSPAWINLAEGFAAADLEPASVSSLRLAAYFSKDRNRTAEYLARITADQSTSAFARIARQVFDELPSLPPRAGGPATQVATSVANSDTLPVSAR